ncbi:hypothetical protein EVAR_46813_1 [Eumeta japonica]|uniref:Uncharacterized protein n=1 Tax=Eumeta variegata TaxID=151549 RepID=A0A4C1XDI6_EUMVA|nr:hypothetical protein EVAR_46813_1 [Eumeta japonica]
MERSKTRPSYNATSPRRPGGRRTVLSPQLRHSTAPAMHSRLRVCFISNGSDLPWCFIRWLNVHRTTPSHHQISRQDAASTDSECVLNNLQEALVIRIRRYHIAAAYVTIGSKVARYISPNAGYLSLQEDEDTLNIFSKQLALGFPNVSSKAKCGIYTYTKHLNVCDIRNRRVLQSKYRSTLQSLFYCNSYRFLGGEGKTISLPLRQQRREQLGFFAFNLHSQLI